MFEPYSPCPCGSGKKFKWCCQPIHASLQKVFALDEDGQHEAAMRLIDEVVAQNPTNPEVWGRKALLQFQNDKAADAEGTLEKAFELHPNYAFGYFLKARFRLHEGEIAGGLLLLRKAADLYDPEARDLLGAIYVDIFDCEMKLNNPIAAHAAAELAFKFQPSNDNLRNGIATVFGKDNPNLPPCATHKYEFKPLPAQAAEDRRAAWAAALKSTTKLTDATRAFEQLAQADGADASAWYNLALCQAWSGNNPAAVAALDRYVALVADETEAARAWMLAEVLRRGQGMIDQADDIEYSIVMVLKDPNVFVAVLGEFQKDGLLAGTQVNQEEGMLTAMLLESSGPALTPELAAKRGLGLAAYVLVVNNIARLWSPVRESLDRIFKIVRDKAGHAIANVHAARGPAKFIEAIAEGITLSRTALTKEEAEQCMREGLTRYFEEKWMQRRLKSLGGVSPLDAALQPALRAKLRGVVDFLRECNELAKLPFDFEPLYQKLGLAGAALASAPVGAAGTAPRDFATLSAADLDTVEPASLGAGEAEQAYQAAVKLNARDVARKFAADLVSRPPLADRPDRFALFQLLIGQALAKGDTTAALDRVNEGEKDDCENNGGKRRNDYELRRGQVHAKRSEFDQAEDVFDRLIARIPSELNVRVSAAETMLSARQGSKATKYAQSGLAEARKQNNRDLEGHFQELLAASQK